MPIKIFVGIIADINENLNQLNISDEQLLDWDASFSSTNASLHRPPQIGDVAKNATLLTDWFQTRGDPVKPKYLKHFLWNRFQGK